MEHAINTSGLIQHFQNEKEGQDRIENLQELVTAAQAFVVEEGYGLDALASVLPANRIGDAAPVLADGDQVLQVLDPEQLPVVMTPLVAFLTHAPLEAGDNQAQAGQDAVQMMTVHAAKGLEFNVVFITGLEEGPVPAREQRDGGRWAGGGAPPDVRGDHPGARAALYVLRPEPRAARPDAISHPLALLRGVARRRR